MYLSLQFYNTNKKRIPLKALANHTDEKAREYLRHIPISTGNHNYFKLHIKIKGSLWKTFRKKRVKLRWISPNHRLHTTWSDLFEKRCVKNINIKKLSQENISWEKVSHFSSSRHSIFSSCHPKLLAWVFSIQRFQWQVTYAWDKLCWKVHKMNNL